MKVGIVLAGLPGYSETFILNKIKMLAQANNASVLLFVDKYSNARTFEGVPVSYSFAQRDGVARFFLLLLVSLQLLMVKPFRCLKFLLSNRRMGMSVYENLKSFSRSAHILLEDPDWLYFAFGTMAIGRECLASSMKCRMAVSFRGYDISIYPLKHPGCYSTLWQMVDRIHVISDDIRDLVYRNGYTREKEVFKILPAIADIGRYARGSIDRPLSSPLKLVTVARLHWKKGLEYTLEALAHLKKSGVIFEYAVIGDGDELERLLFAVHQLGLTGQVRFLGSLSHQDTLDVVKNCDMYIQFSIQEGFCNAVLEAQALGLLTIVSDAEGLSENVIHNETGWVVKRREAALLAGAIQKVIQLPRQELAGIRSRAMARVRENFNLRKQQHEFEVFYGLTET